MPILELIPSARSNLRAAAHALDPIVLIGEKGLTESVLKEIDRSLTAHGLLKIRVNHDEREVREALFLDICEQLNAAPVHHLGRTLIIYRPKPEKLPESIKKSKPHGAPKEVKVTIPSRTGKRPPQRKEITVLSTQRVTAGGLVKKAKVRQSSTKKRALPQ